MSIKRDKLASNIKSKPLYCPSTSLLKTGITKEAIFRSPLMSIKSYRKLGKTIVPNILIKGNQTPNMELLQKQPKARSVCLIRDAIQCKEWLGRARDGIIQELSLFINASNCINVEVPIGSITYKYYLAKGNNSPLIKQCFNSRPWWVPVEDDQIFSANFAWTQFKNPEQFFLMPIAYDRLKKINHDLQGRSIACNTLYEDITNSLRSVDISSLGYDLITKSLSYISFDDNFRIDPTTSRLQNKLEYNFNLSDKKFLYMNMKEYYESINDNVFNYLPLTFHIGVDSSEMGNFISAHQESGNKSLWIVKPGENTNRGNGIFVSNDIFKIVSSISEQSTKNSHTFIIQKYIEKPLLINRRKFDIRIYTLVTSINGVFQAYFYQEGYLRTACKIYNPNDLDNKYIHLTNDAIQKNCEDYGKFENGNKLSYHDFQRYLDTKGIKVNFLQEVIPKVKQIIKDTIKATQNKLNKDRRLLNFEIFGYDFLLDSSFRPWLLEVNTNPCLELSSTILARIIPAMIENAFKIALDPLFPEPKGNSRKFSNRNKDLLPENKFELIYHQDNSD